MSKLLNKLKIEVKEELNNNILDFWIEKMVDSQNGGFYGQINGNDQLVTEAEKGGILNARILWTFSAAYYQDKNPNYLKIANRAKEYVTVNFFDEKYGGTYWKTYFDGNPSDKKKQIYSQAFFIYAFSEHYRATGDESSLRHAIELFEIIEKYSFDHNMNGYFEGYTQDWKILEDLRLSEKDENQKKTMNTHLHILEAYTNLYRVWKDEKLAKQLHNLILIFTEKIINPETKHLDLFFDENWNSKAPIVSFGHDIEASWLIDEAARVLGNKNMLQMVQKMCVEIAVAACNGLQDDGSLIYEENTKTNQLDKDRHWWVQAEAIVGFMNAYELTGDKDWLRKAISCWDYIKERLIDKNNGEWFWSVSDNGIVNHNEDKAGFWKCPYHNSRMCMEIITRR